MAAEEEAMSVPNKLALKVLESLIREWQVNFSTEEIGCDYEKVRLLAEVRNAVGDEPVRLSQNTRNLYKKAFLKDVWSKKGSGE